MGVKVQGELGSRKGGHVYLTREEVVEAAEIKSSLTTRPGASLLGTQIQKLTSYGQSARALSAHAPNSLSYNLPSTDIPPPPGCDSCCC